jgi:hypothetical protein
MAVPRTHARSEEAATNGEPVAIPDRPVRSPMTAAPQQAPDPSSLIASLLSEAESRRKQEDEARQAAAERKTRLDQHQALRERLARAFHLAYTFPAEVDWTPDVWRQVSERLGDSSLDRDSLEAGLALEMNRARRRLEGMLGVPVTEEELIGTQPVLGFRPAGPSPGPLPSQQDDFPHQTPEVLTPEAPPPPGRAPSGLTFLPGAFTYREYRQQLKGKPLKVLRALSEATGMTLTLAALRDKVWTDSVIGEEAIRSAVATARKALREAIQAAGAETADPIPVVDRGTNSTAWRLDLP